MHKEEGVASVGADEARCREIGVMPSTMGFLGRELVAARRSALSSRNCAVNPTAKRLRQRVG